MKKYWIGSAVLSVTLMVGVVYGVVIQRHRVFPHGILRKAWLYLNPPEQEPSHGPWSIGIYQGSTPFDLADADGVSNPVVSAEDVLDVDATFVADPFMAVENGDFYMFFEVWNRETDHGDIGLSVSPDGKQWEYRRIVIDEPFHLSYPQVFKSNGEYFLIPESNDDLSVRLYRAVSFPNQWQHVGNLLTGYRFVDPSIFRHDDKWWLFVSTPSNDILNLYYSSDLLGDWRPHPMNPIIKFDEQFARPAGRVISRDGRLYRLAQDDVSSYGVRVYAFEITELTEESYAEEIASDKPLVDMTGTGWNAAGMHHVDLQMIGDSWMAVVDGRDR